MLPSTKIRVMQDVKYRKVEEPFSWGPVIEGVGFVLVILLTIFYICFWSELAQFFVHQVYGFGVTFCGQRIEGYMELDEHLEMIIQIIKRHNAVLDKLVDRIELIETAIKRLNSDINVLKVY